MGTKAPALIALYSTAPQMGKSTVSRLLIEGLGYTPVKFAGPVKAVTAVFLSEMGVPEAMLPEYLEGHLKEESLGDYGFDALTSRKIQQVMGTEAGRKALDTNLWTTIAGRKIRKLLDQGKRVVVDDMRFPNEYDLINALGGERWCVFNPRVEITVSTHPSEGLLDNHAFERALINEGTINDLHQQVSEAVTRF